MLIVKLAPKWRSKLAGLPESGMGYQRVNITLSDGRVLKDVMVFNGEECQVEFTFQPDDVVEVSISEA